MSFKAQKDDSHEVRERETDRDRGRKTEMFSRNPDKSKMNKKKKS